jgi:hypothetical protein
MSSSAKSIGTMALKEKKEYEERLYLANELAHKIHTTKTKLVQDTLIPEEIRHFDRDREINITSDARELSFLSSLAIIRELQQFKSYISSELNVMYNILSPSIDSLYTELQEIQKAVIVLNPTYETIIQKSILNHLQLEDKLTNSMIREEVLKTHIKKWKDILNVLIRIELDKDEESSDIL